MPFNPKFSISIQTLLEVSTALGDKCPAEIAEVVEMYAELTSPNPIERNGVKYTKPDHKQFILEAENAGYDVRLYHGRFYWHGPAVAVEAGDSGFTTSVKTQHDSLGLGRIIYPIIPDSSLKDVHENREEDAEDYLDQIS